MGNFSTKHRRHHHHQQQQQSHQHNQTQYISPLPTTTSSSSTTTTSYNNNNNNNNNSNQNNPLLSPSLSLPPPPPTPPRSYAFAANAPPPPMASTSFNSYNYPPFPPPTSVHHHLYSYNPNQYHHQQQASGWAPVRPTKIKNDVNVHKDSIRVVLDDNNLDSHLVSFTFDAVVDGSITIINFAKEGADCIFTPLYPEIYMPRRIPFQKGLGQKFSQPSGTGIDLGFFELDDLSKTSPQEDVFPLVISAETSLPSFSLGAEPDNPLPTMSRHAQITLAVLEKNKEGHFQVRVIKQILWVYGVRYELRDIYGIGNSEEAGFDDSEPGKECVICMSEPKDTAVLPCRHLCMCSECAKALRLQSTKCPICRQPIQQLIEIKESS